MKETKIYKNKRNGQEATYLFTYEDGRVELELQDGTRKAFIASTFKRWWALDRVEVEDDVIQPVEENTVIAEPTTAKTAKKEQRTLQEEQVKKLLDFIFKAVVEFGGEIFIPANPNLKFRSFKIGGKMFAAVNWSGKTVSINTRQAAVQDLGYKYKEHNHMFNAVFTYTTTAGTLLQIGDILKASMNYQIHKNNSKTKKG